MAKPRVFISSTYYDLQTVRADLEEFIVEHGYEPVLFEKGHVAYGAEDTLEHDCYQEISACDILVNIVGGRFGTESKDAQHSISQNELRIAYEQGKLIYVFVETAVLAEYRTYTANKNVAGFIPITVNDLRIFAFLEEVLPLSVVESFKISHDIIDFLKKQWAGLFQNMLVQRASGKRKARQLFGGQREGGGYSPEKPAKNVDVIFDVAQAIRTPTVNAAASINAVTGAITNAPVSRRKAPVTVNVQENFLDAFGKFVGTGDTNANISKMIRLTVSKIPADVTLNFPVSDSSGLFTLTAANGALATAAATLTGATTPGAVYYRLTTNSDPTKLESLVVPISVGLVAGATFPLPGGSVTVSAHMAPFDDPACETGAVTILSITGASTSLLVPYATTGVGYDTGITVANTTLDPGTQVMGFTQAVRQAGTIRFDFFPQTGDTFTYTTQAGSPGSGLAADGSLAQGRTYVVLLSELLGVISGAPAEFNGYIFITTNFTNAYGEYFISNFEFFTYGALMPVVNRT
ncbi:MAG: DUF4062 domain-containing protein [Acidobacteria bacterium]|nr:DUF4062 domain-containing protein [Acidobacteriota bacterium]